MSNLVMVEGLNGPEQRIYGPWLQKKPTEQFHNNTQLPATGVLVFKTGILDFDGEVFKDMHYTDTNKVDANGVWVMLCEWFGDAFTLENGIEVKTDFITYNHAIGRIIVHSPERFIDRLNTCIDDIGNLYAQCGIVEEMLKALGSWNLSKYAE